MNLRNKGNEYQHEYPNFEKTPKTVAAAVAISLALRLCSDDIEAARKMVASEWASLNDAGIVPQKPPRA